MKNKPRLPSRGTSSALRIARSAAVSERRRRLSLWNFYQQNEVDQADAEPPRRSMPERILTEPSSR